MRLLAAGCVGAFCALVAALITGSLPRARLRSPRARASGADRAQVWLQQAGAGLTPGQFATGSVAAGSVAFLAGTVLTGAPVVAAVPAVVVAMLPRAYFSRRRAARLRLVQEAWPDGLRDLVASVRAGRSLAQALHGLATTGPAPLREAFARFPALARVLGTVPALEVVREELADPTTDKVVEVLVLAHERGGRIVGQVLEDLIDATTRDLKIQEEIASEGLEMRINARAVLVLPWLVLLALTVGNDAFRAFYRSGRGTVIVVLGALLSLVGAWLLGRLGREHREERVLGAVPAGSPG